MLLVTDGGASCDATPESLEELAETMLESGTRTAVVGFMISENDVTNGAGAPAMLEAQAAAGGFPQRGGETSYWLANDASELGAALDEIVSESVSCTFALSETPPNIDELYAFVDGEELTRDGADGWTYDAADNTVTFQGAACERIQAGEVHNINVVFGCPENICTPTEEVCDGLDNDCDGEVDEDCPY